MRSDMLLGEYKSPDGKKSKFNKERWAFLMDAPFEVSNQCCTVMKKRPMDEYCRRTGRKAITGQMAAESLIRARLWIQYGCNMYDATHPKSNPMSIWTEQDVLHYIKEHNIKIASVYGEIVPSGEEIGDARQMTFADITGDYEGTALKTTGCNRTGCMFCGYGCHLEKGEGRFERMKRTHPKQYEWIMKPTKDGGLGYKEIIDWLNENGKLNIKY